MSSLHANISSKLLGGDVVSTRLSIYFYKRAVNLVKLDSLCSIFPQKREDPSYSGQLLGIFSKGPAPN